MNFHLNRWTSSSFKLCRCIGDVNDTGQRFMFVLDLSEIIYFLENESPPKPLDVATSNFADNLVRSKAGICDGVPSTEV